MEYGIRELAEMAGVSTRTLRWYDSISLLSPSRVSENGYRRYSNEDVNRLQHILYYRALGLELKQIASILNDPSFDRKNALRSHLEALEKERRRVDALISSVRRTLQAEERNEALMDHEKFEAFKHARIAKNEEQHGKEARSKYGDEAVDASNRKLLGLSEEECSDWESTGDAIRARLEAAVTGGKDPAGPEGRAIAELHKKWLCFSWEKYTPQAHRGVAEMYLLDERFTQYYDSAVTGCAKFLRDAIVSWLEK